jgi:proteasome assembly chaperone (PAC2) family protein
MAAAPLKILSLPKLTNGRMVIAFSGWMDGGNVSTGSVEWLVRTLAASKVAEIDPEGFFIYNFPGSMEVSALFRPHTSYENGQIIAYEPPENEFYCSEAERVIFFTGKEPNLNWERFADCIFRFAAAAGVTTLYFVGSVGGTVPHTREPRLRCTVSDARLKPLLEPFAVRFASYDGPASFSTHLLVRAAARGLAMVNLVAEIPAYIQGTNPKSIEAVIRRLAGILKLEVDVRELRDLGTVWEERLNAALERREDVSTQIRKLEENYDSEVFDTEMGELKEWLEEQGIRVD